MQYSGVPPLAMLFGLVAFSVPYIRHRIYEGFYYLHALLAIMYTGLLFWHAANILDSWAYLWATLGLWLASYLARVFWYTQPLNLSSEWFVGAPTTMVKLSGEMTRIEVLAPPGFRHRPAQHCFLRFPSISLIDNHPFTIASAPDPGNHAIETTGLTARIYRQPQTLVFLARTHSGFTRRLAAYCDSQPDVLASAWIDGPYGGIPRQVERFYDKLIIIAGGTGITACIPWLRHIVDRSTGDARKVLDVKHTVLVWVRANEEHLDWVAETLRDTSVVAKGRKVVVEMNFYVTRGSTMPTDSPTKTLKEQDATKGLDSINIPSSPSSRGQPSREFIRGRPKMSDIISDLLGPGRNFVFGCGPESLRTDLSNACANAQRRVLKDEVQEVAMHLEAFAW
jgi:Ferric reductase NAD binding domain/FAD-binding domain